jgi:hypothetical protein
MRLNLNLLRQRLGQFGLNPLDWCVEVRSKRGNLMKIEISSLNGENMCFEGWAENANWLSLAYCDF